MTFNPNLSTPFGYQKATRTLRELNNILLLHYHPEYIRRLLAWLSSMHGGVGVGGHWRVTGSQPDKPGFAPEGKSFHQDQRYNDGFVGACAVDVVARNPTGGIHIGVNWGMVPRQGTALAVKWGVHANINSEPWHIQPVEIDGWQSWKNVGGPAPKRNYPLPNDPIVPPPIIPDPPSYKGNNVMLPMIGKYPNNGAWVYSLDGGVTHRAIRTGQTSTQATALVAGGAIDCKTLKIVTSWTGVQGFSSNAEAERYLGRKVG